MFLYMDGTHAVVLLDLKCVFELLHIGTALRTPPLQGHPGHPCPDKPWCQRQSRQGAHGDIHHLWTEATAEKEISILSFPSKRWRNDCHGFNFSWDGGMNIFQSERWRKISENEKEKDTDRSALVINHRGAWRWEWRRYMSSEEDVKQRKKERIGRMDDL